MPASTTSMPMRLMRTWIALLIGLAMAPVVHADDESRISMTMKDADLAEVMDMISLQQRINIFVSSDDEELVSFSLYDMTVPDAIRAIANAAGLAVEYFDGSYFIVERDEAGKYSPDSLTRVESFELQYINVEEIQALLQPYLSDYGEVTVFRDRNLFLVEDTAGFLKRIRTLVRKIDVPPTQILIEARILEITLTDEDSYGLDWTKFFDGSDGSGTFGAQGLNDETSPGFFFDFSNPNIAATLNALTSQGRVRTLSTPKLLATENEEASVIIGDRRGYSVVTTINQVTTESIEFLESGVILRVTPTVDADGQIMMNIHPEVSTGVIDPLSGIPSQTTTEVTTRMIVPTGQTIFVGGLIKHRVDESKRGVPVLGRIPGVGRLFSNRQTISTKTETVVLITPTIVTAPNSTLDGDVDERIRDFSLDQESEAEGLNDEMSLFFDGARRNDASGTDR